MDGKNVSTPEQLLTEIRQLLGVMHETLAEGEFIATMFKITVAFRELDELLKDPKNSLPKDWKHETVGEYALRVTGSNEGFEVI